MYFDSVAKTVLSLGTLWSFTSVHSQKSFGSRNPQIRYAEEQSFRLNPNQVSLLQETLRLSNGVMAGAPEVIRTNMVLIKAIRAKRVLDIGLFTGSTALGAALALPRDGQVIGIDVNRTYWDQFGSRYARSAGVVNKIDARFHPSNAANVVLDDLIRRGESGRFDFCFIDANKDQYLDYYQKCKQLIRSGGIIAIDNVIWGANPSTASAAAIHRMNQFIANDSGVLPMMLNIAQGLSVVYKM